VKKIRPSYPRRAELLRTPFASLSDDEFRRHVAEGSAIPSQLGDVLFVSKWRDGPGMGADAFLAALHAQGATLEARTYQKDVNIRVVRSDPKKAPAGKPSAKSPKTTR
jgi:hypothetical protein